MKRVFWALCIVSLCFVSCNSSKYLTDVKDKLAGAWALQALEGQTDLSSLFKGKQPEVNFDLDNAKIFGNNGCNNFSGAFSLGNAGKINLGDIAETKMACMDSGNGDQLFSQALS